MDKSKQNRIRNNLEIDSTILILPNMDLECSLCMNTLSDPVQCMNGHLFCHQCITPHLNVKGVCPVCININVTSNTDDYYERIPFFPAQNDKSYPNDETEIKKIDKKKLEKNENYMINKISQLSDSLEALRKQIKYKFNTTEI